MGKGGGGGSRPTETTSTVTQTNLPAYVEPYFKDLLKKAETESGEAYEPYEGERIAGLQTEHETALAHAGAVAGEGRGGPQIREAIDILSREGAYRPASVGYTPGQFDPGYTAAAGPGAYQAGQIASTYDPTQITSGYAPDPSQFTTQTFTDPGVASEYMNPFIENVINRQQARARRQFSEEQIPAMRARAVEAGAFGGRREAIREQLARERLEERLGDIESTQRGQAYREAQSAFTRDRAEVQRAQQMRDAAARARGQLGLAAQQATAEEERVAAQLGLTGSEAQEQARLRAAHLGLQGYETQERARQQQAQFGIDTQKAREQASQLAARTALDSERLGIAGAQQRAATAQPLAGLGTTQQAFGLKQADVFRQIGDVRAAQKQQEQDLAYADFLSQRDYPKTQLGWMGGILHGVPVSPTSESTVYRAQPPVSQQLAGFGLGGASILNQLGRG